MQEMEQERLGPDHTSYHLAMDAAGRGSGEGIWTFDLPWSASNNIVTLRSIYVVIRNKLILDVHGLKMSKMSHLVGRMW